MSDLNSAKNNLLLCIAQDEDSQNLDRASILTNDEEKEHKLVYSKYDTYISSFMA